MGSTVLWESAVHRTELFETVPDRDRRAWPASDFDRFDATASQPARPRRPVQLLDTKTCGDEMFSEEIDRVTKIASHGGIVCMSNSITRTITGFW